MNEPKPNPFDFDPRTPRTAHRGITAEIYEDLIPQGAHVLNVAAGHTDLQDDLRKRGISAKVTSVDPSYAGNESAERLAAVAQALPLPDESVDVTICQYGMQHFGSAASDAVREMVRVTKTADGPDDGGKGIIVLNPIYRVNRVRKALLHHGLLDVGAVLSHVDDDLPFEVRHSLKPTLLIHKTDILTPEKLEELIKVLDETKGMKPFVRSPGEIASRLLGGYSLE